ncbi:MAG TPA: IpaD/SipD/SspD family type III secretion system needle tip protein, partial [Herbaspirillum sp.]
ADGNITMSASKFQSWRAGFDDQANAIKDTSSVMAKKLVNAQSVYENLIKVLSATIAAMLETCKLCVQN